MARPEVSVLELLEGYLAERKPSPKSAKKFAACINKLVEFVGHSDAHNISRTDILRWKDYLLGPAGLSSKTVKEGYLAAASVVLGWGAENERIKSNPAAAIKVRSQTRVELRERDLTEEEASTILKAALSIDNPQAKTTAAVRRWVPWICAYTGARVNEITQLRAEDVRVENGVPFIEISPEAGSVKTHKARTVPLHDDLIHQGFLEFAATVQGPLFYDPSRSKGGSDAHPQYAKAGERLAAWVRALGVDDPNVAPNHGWRHRFVTLSRSVGMREDVSNSITGHTSGEVKDAYGMNKLEAQKLEIDKLPTNLSSLRIT